eukprot:TRINITY_DN9586_c0_g1_i1.p1 TRINITY_DN9586_c0_g1~~TRINITY_DN9586_c0_g1_i1.p1  ORF type:complete len:329 (-),score=60.17 TRINITY_DN9586_c0_g1_i1:458-1444(-)
MSDFFSQDSFFIVEKGITKTQCKILRKNIIEKGGIIHNEVQNDDDLFVIASKLEEALHYFGLDRLPKSMLAIDPAWISECLRSGKRVSTRPFLFSPNQITIVVSSANEKQSSHPSSPPFSFCAALGVPSSGWLHLSDEEESEQVSFVDLLKQAKAKSTPSLDRLRPIHPLTISISPTVSPTSSQEDQLNGKFLGEGSSQSDEDDMSLETNRIIASDPQPTGIAKTEIQKKPYTERLRKSFACQQTKQKMQEKESRNLNAHITEILETLEKKLQHHRGKMACFCLSKSCRCPQELPQASHQRQRDRKPAWDRWENQVESSRNFGDRNAA